MDQIIDLDTYKRAIAKHQKISAVLLIHLKLDSPDAMVRRRQKYDTMQKRLPMEDDKKGCQDLYQALQLDIDNFLDEVAESLGIPLLQTDNGDDGKEAMDKTLREILLFVQQHFHRQVITA